MKKEMFPLINDKLTLALKISCLIPIGIYGYTLATLDWLSVYDLIALALTFFGTLFAVKAKIDLGECHTWTGYCLKTTNLVVKGIYAYIRHPLYVGIYISIFGGLLTLISHAPWFLTSIALITLGYIIPFLGIAATRETKFLAQEFGEEFLKYKDQVHPFLPLRKYSKQFIKK